MANTESQPVEWVYDPTLAKVAARIAVGMLHARGYEDLGAGEIAKQATAIAIEIARQLAIARLGSAASSPQKEQAK